jgi:hypothetical protein
MYKIASSPLLKMRNTRIYIVNLIIFYGVIGFYVVGIWTYKEQPCYQRLRPTDSSQKLMETCG